MTDVIIFGVGKTAERILNMLKSNVNVVAFVDNYNYGITFHGKNVLSSSELNNKPFSYIFIASVYGSEIERQLILMGISPDKIIRMISDKKGGHTALFEYHYLVHNPFKERLKEFLSKNDIFQIMITGISYHNDGIEPSIFEKPLFNFALRGQDIYYDYQIIKYLLQNYKDKMIHIKYVIVGLTYYSFEYDFSKSSSAVEAMRYYPEIADAHNFADNQCLKEIWNLLHSNLDKYKEVYKMLDFNINYILDDEEGKKVAEADQNKNYPYTVCENIYFLDKYLTYLENNNIIPIILIMPVTKYYKKYYKKENIDMFYHNLHKAIRNRDIQILDYFNKINLDDEYWYHVSHLNHQGARIFSKILQKDINW